MMDITALPTDQPGVTLLPRFLSDGELAALLREADVVALPYRSIDNSGVVFAALALGAGVVMSDVGGLQASCTTATAWECSCRRAMPARWPMR